jgi:hypothetical protein
MTDRKSDVTLNIMRETSDVGDHAWLNRYCQDGQTHVTTNEPKLTLKQTVYYCDAAPDHKLIVHRGDKSGPVIATGDPCLSKEGLTEIHFPESETVIELQHVHHKFLHLHGKTTFTFNGKRYHWKGHTVLVESDTDVVIAVYHSMWFDANWERLGSLEIASVSKEITDVVVITALVLQERSDEGRQAVAH